MFAFKSMQEDKKECMSSENSGSTQCKKLQDKGLWFFSSCLVQSNARFIGATYNFNGKVLDLLNP